MSQLTRRQLRHLIKEEYYNATKSKQLNESATLVAGLGFTAIVGITAILGYLDAKFHVPTDRLTGDPLYVQEYDALGKAIIDGAKPEDAVIAALNKNSKIANSFISSSAPVDDVDSYEQYRGHSDKYGAQDPTYDGYDNLGLYEKRSRRRRRY